MLSKVEIGFVIGAVPSAAMTLAILLLTKVEVSAPIEASLQNFSAGLILAAVATELFPVMMEGGTDVTILGISLGFIVGLGTIYGLEYIVDYLEHIDEKPSSPLTVLLDLCCSSSGVNDTASTASSNNRQSLVKSFPKSALENGSEGGADETDELYLHTTAMEVGWEEEHVELASLALSLPEHRQHLHEHLKELLEAIKQIREKSEQLRSPELTIRQVEEIAEHADEQIHLLQYKLDHCRRLLEGSEAELLLSKAPQSKQTWVTDERKDKINRGIRGLEFTAEHLLEHLAEAEHSSLDKSTIKEIRIHMDVMDKQINSFHGEIDHVARKWSRTHHLIATAEGDKLPMGLVLPVYMDAFVDGFLMGISSAISLEAGIVLGAASSLEMSFLGMAYSSRIVKCTGSSPFARNIALYSPPLIMFLAAGLGALIGQEVEQIRSLFIAMVAFGTVALLFLVCNELLIEAKEAQGEEERWWISIMVFVGIYIVLIMGHLVE